MRMYKFIIMQLYVLMYNYNVQNNVLSDEIKVIIK